MYLERVEECVVATWDTIESRLNEDESKEIFDLYQKFVEEFKKETKISIELQYHDKEVDGSRYDMVDGGFWELDFDDIFQYTPEAESLRKIVRFEWVKFVEFC